MNSSVMNSKAAEPAGAAADPADAYNITDARTAHTDEMHQRLVKYSVAMGIRMVCLILIFVLDGWLKIIAVAGAVLLPWFAVIIANAGSDTTNEHAGALLDQAPLAELEAPREHAAGADQDILQGEFVTDSGEGTADDGVPGDGAGGGTSGGDPDDGAGHTAAGNDAVTNEDGGKR